MARLARFVIPMLVGFSIGVMFSCLTVLKQVSLSVMQGHLCLSTDLTENETVFTEIGTTRSMLPEIKKNLSVISFNDSQFHGDDTTVADRLYQSVRILCLVMTYPENHRKKAIHVNATWGKRCNKLLFVTGTADNKLPTLVLKDVKDGREHLGAKTREAFDHAYKHYLDDFDWFLKADDDTYVIVENLRYFLSEQDPKSPVFFGQTFIVYVDQGYPSGGAGYVASREALKQFGRRKKQTSACQFNTKVEDVDFGRCMESLGVRLGDSLDAIGRTRFHCLMPVEHIGGLYPDWYSGHDKYNGTKQGLDGLSDYAISFHYIEPGDMYLIEYFVYHLNPHGIIKGFQNLNVMQSKIEAV